MKVVADVADVFAATDVISITASPNSFNPTNGETTTVTVEATPATSGLELRVLNADASTVVRSGLILTEGAAGVYTTLWNGRNNGGGIVSAGDYVLRVYNPATNTYMGPQGSVAVTAPAPVVTSVVASPDPFVPTGSNSTTITVQATPGQAGLKVVFAGSYGDYWGNNSGSRYLPLTETAVLGTYIAQWDAVCGYYTYYNYACRDQTPTPSIMRDATYTIRVYDAANTQYTTTGTVQVTGVASVSPSVSRFAPSSGETVTFTANGATGLNLDAQIKNSSGTLLRTLPMTGSGPYTATWDGRDASGNLVSVGSYTIYVYNRDSGQRYYPTTSVTVAVGVTSVVASPDPFVPTGSNSTTITVEATPGQTGLKVAFYAGYWGTSWYDSNRSRYLSLAETATPGIYTAQWDGVCRYYSSYYNGCDSNQGSPNQNAIMQDATYTISVFDAANTQYSTTGTVRVTGVASVTTSVSRFAPSSGEMATFTANGVAALNLDVQIKNSSGTLVQTLSMTGSGPYTATWDGRDASGNLVSVGSYTIYVYNRDSGQRYYPTTSVTVAVGVTSVVASPDPFVPTGSNSTTITVEATPGQTGLKVMFSAKWYDSNGSRYLPLTETTTPGVYTAQWDAVCRSTSYNYGYRCSDAANTTMIAPNVVADGTYVIYVYDAAGNQYYSAAWTVRLTGVASVTTSPNPFTPGGNNVTTITAGGGTGHNLEARVYNNTTSALTRTLPLTGASGTYRADWDGTDAYGNFAGAGTYSVRIYNMDSGQRYYPTTSITVNVAVFSISASPDPFVPDGANTTTITLRADKGQAGLTASISHQNGASVSGLSFRETGSEGTYVATWDGKFGSDLSPSGICTIRVYNSSGAQFPTTGTLTVSSAKTFTVSSSSFEPGGGTTVTITAEVATGLNLEARIGSARTLPLSETSSGIYTTSWDGADSSGTMASAGYYTIYLYNSTTGARYTLSTSLTIVDTTPPDTSITSGPGEGATYRSTDVTFTWTGTDNIDVTAYSYKMDSADWSAFSTTTSFTFTGLSQGAHTFTVRARDGAGNIDPTPDIRNFIIDSIAPVISAVSASDITADSAVITWTTDEGATSQVQYGTTASYGSFTPLDSGLVTNHRIVLTGLTPGTEHHYRVRSMDAAGNEAVSGDYTFTTAPLPDTTAPSTPANLIANGVFLSQINLSWTVSTDTGGSGLAGYRVFRDGAQIAAVGPTTTSYSDTGLAYGITYTYYVVAFDGAGNSSSQSNLVQATTGDGIAPNISANFNATPLSSSEIMLSWDPATDNVGITSYRIEFYQGSTYIGQVSVPGSVTSYMHTGLLSGTFYQYTLFAFDAGGNTSSSKSTSATTLSPPSLAITANDITTWPGDNRTVSAKFKNTGGQSLTISNIQVTGVDWLAPISSLPALSPEQEVELWFRLSVPATATGGVYPNPQVYPAVIGVNTTDGSSFNSAFSINVFKESTSILNIQVLADNTGVPLSGAMVTLEGSATSYSTDSNGRVQITTAPGIKNIYAYKDGYKPLALSANLSPLENNLTLRLHPGEVLVVDQVQVTPLTQQEIIDRGVQLTDPTNYWVYDFTVALAIDGTPTTINQTSVVLPTNPAPGTTTTLQSTTVQSSGGGTSSIQTTVIALPEGKRAYAFLLIPGEIKLLKEFFEAKVIVKNEAATDFVITGTTATLNIPSALALVPLNGLDQQATLALGDIAGGSQAEAAWILRGDAEGEHTIGVNATGVLQPFGLTLTASNTGHVKVYGKSNLSAVFNVPSIVSAGEEFVFAVTVTNTSPVTVNGVSVGLDTGDFVNVHLASGESPVKYIGILPEAGMTGNTQTVEFRLVSEVDGVISTAHSAVYSDPQLLASLTIISCPHDVGEGASNSELTAFTNAYNDAGGYTALGCPQGAVRPALASGAISSTSTGLVQDFEKGHIHLISGDTTAHATTGAIETIYFDMGATASQLGFPISDPYITVEGYTGQGFEGGSMYTDLAGVTYTIFTIQPQLIKLDSDYRVYYVHGNVNRHIPDPETFELLRFDWNAITTVASVGTPGAPVPALRTGSAKDGSLIRRMIGGPGNTIKVYLIENGIARHVPDPDTLFAMGRRFNEVIEMESLLFDRIPKGPDIPSVDSSAADDSFIHFVSGFGLDAPAGFVAGVNTAIGNYSHRRTDLVIPGRGLSLALSSTYNAKDSYDHVMGPGWTHSYDMEAMETQKTPPGGTTPVNVFVSVKWGDGHEEFYQWDTTASSYKAIKGVHNILSGGGGSNILTVLTRSQVQYVFELLEPMTNISQDKNGDQTLITTNRYRLKSISDRNGNAITLNYSGLLSSVTDSVGRTIAFTYTEMTDQSTGTTVTRLTKVTDPIGRTVEFTYDADGKITEIKDPSVGVTKYSYKKDKVMGLPTPLIEEIKDPRGNPAVYNTYKEDIARPDYKKVDSISIGGTPHTISNDGNTTTVTDPVSYRRYTHDKNRLISMADPAGNIGIAYDDLNFMNPNSIKDKMDGYTTFEYDARGNILEATDALGNATRFEYDSRNNLTRKTDPLGRVTTYSYDASGNLTRITTPVGSTDITYDSYGQPETVTDPNGNTTTYIYDSQGNLSEVRQPLGRTTRYGYDSVGRRISVTDANNNTTAFSYDNNNRLLSVTDPLGKAERYEYDLNGNKTAVIDRNGNRDSYTYDEKNRLIKTVDANGSATVYEYDLRDRMTKITDADNKDTRYEYDEVGNLIKVTDANNGVVTYTYNANGNRLSMTDPKSHTTGYEYDALNRIIKKTEPLNGQYRYVYDIAGNMTSMTDAKGNTTQYSYDSMDRLSLITYIDSSTVSFNYDSNGNRTRMVDSAGTTIYTYDALNRLINYTDPFGKAVGYGYDSNGNRLSMTYPDGKVVQYGYDNLNRLASATDWLNRTASYFYDSASRLTGTINPNSTTVSYSYDNANRLTGLINRKSNSTVISSYSYILDAVGNHAQSAQTEPLLPAMPDRNIGYAYDEENRLTNAGGVSFRFDANGNMEAKGNDTFSYDYRDKLIQSIIAGKITQYQYNGAGDRLSKTTEDGITKRYVLDINSGLPNVLAETDGNGNITAYYVYGLELISKVLPDGAAFYYHYDSRGSTIALTDAGQNITDAYAYDPFGKVVNSKVSTPNPFRYVGRYGLMDEENGLIYVRARYYAPELERFITKDPLTGEAGDSQSLNRYVYGGSNPVIYIDTNGLNISIIGNIAYKSAKNFLKGKFIKGPLMSYTVDSEDTIEIGKGWKKNAIKSVVVASVTVVGSVAFTPAVGLLAGAVTSVTLDVFDYTFLHVRSETIPSPEYPQNNLCGDVYVDQEGIYHDNNHPCQKSIYKDVSGPFIDQEGNYVQ